MSPWLKVFRQCRRYAEVRDNPGGLTLDSVQKSKFSLADPRRVRQDRLEYRLQVSRRVRDDLEYLRRRRLLLQRLGELPFQVGVGCAKAVNISSRLRCLRTKTGNLPSALRPFARQDHLVAMVDRRIRPKLRIRSP